jgi:hypothetical protein
VPGSSQRHLLHACLPAGEVGKLEALDNDEPKNGPPFKFEIDPRAPPAIKTKFSVQQGATAAGDYFLYTKVKFDREEQKVYEIPIQVRRNTLSTLCRVGYSDFPRSLCFV